MLSQSQPGLTPRRRQKMGRDSKVHGANMGPTWVLSASDGPHVGPMNLAIRDTMRYTLCVTFGQILCVSPVFRPLPGTLSLYAKHYKCRRKPKLGAHFTSDFWPGVLIYCLNFTGHHIVKTFDHAIRAMILWQQQNSVMIKLVQFGKLRMI